jgi:hypothetical protein
MTPAQWIEVFAGLANVSADAVLVVVVIALVRGRLVPRWVYDELKARVDGRDPR